MSNAPELTPEKALIFRITHIANVPWMLEHGVHCRNSKKKNPNFVRIGDPELIDKRATRVVPKLPGGTLSDYIPFYFTPYSPMLLKIKTGHGRIRQWPMSEIAILVSSLPRLEEIGKTFLFSDRHAYLRAARFSQTRDDLDRIDWALLRARDFKRDPENPQKFERYEAEALVHQILPINGLLGVACYDKEQSAKLAKLVEKRGVTLPVRARPGWYF